MGISIYPNSLKSRYAVTLTSGTSYTVPAGAYYVNVTLVGGAGGGVGAPVGGLYTSYIPYCAPGNVVLSTLATTPGATITYAIGAGGTAGANTGAQAGTGGTTTFTGATSATGGLGARANNGGLAAGLVGSVGAMNTGGQSGVPSASTATTGGVGGAGFIIVEYWV